MSIEKLLKSVLAVGIFVAGSAGAGNMAPSEIEKYRFPNYPYKGAYWGSDGHSVKYGNEVIMSEASSMAVMHGLYKNDVNKIQDKGFPKRKIVIKQKTPCYVVPKNWDKFTRGVSKGKQIFGRNVEKIDSHTVAVYKESNGGLQNTRISGMHRRGLTSMKLQGSTLVDVTPKKLTKENSTIILGDSFECLKEQNEETWKVYWKLKGSWVLMAEEKFIINP